MSFKFAITLLLSLTATLSASARADGTRGGGNAIRCDDGKLYAWDYINAKFENMPIDEQLLAARDTKGILETIAKRLPEISLDLAFTLDDFRKFNSDLYDESSTRVWISGKNPLINVGDEDRTRIPKSCVANADAGFKLYQAVIRTQSGSDGKIRYEFDPELTAELERTNPIQLSFLYIHEWLRDFLKDANSIALATQLIHSTRFAKATPSASHRVLGEIGIRLKTLLLKGHYPLVSGKALLSNMEIGYGLAQDKKSYVYIVKGTLPSSVLMQGRYVDSTASSLRFVNSKSAKGSVEIKEHDGGHFTDWQPNGGITGTIDFGKNEIDLHLKHFETAGKTCFRVYFQTMVVDRWDPSRRELKESRTGVYCH